MADQDDAQPIRLEEEISRLRKQARCRNADADAAEAHARAVEQNPSAAKSDPPSRSLALAKDLRRRATELDAFADELEG